MSRVSSRVRTVMFFPPAFQCILLLMAALYCNGAIAQLPEQRPCESNAYGWSINRVYSKDNSTFVDLTYYAGAKIEFWIPPGTYIESAEGAGKYYIKRLVDYELGTRYTIPGRAEQLITLEFARIPDSWTTITIREPAVSGATAWYWKNVPVSWFYIRPEAERFFRDEALKTIADVAHPLNTHLRYRYNINHDKIWINIIYEESYLELELTKKGDVFTYMRIVNDTDDFPTFFSLELIRDAIVNETQAQRYISYFEELLGKTLRQMTGPELACLLLTIQWNIYRS